MKRLKGFTLAEVLITLAIIGVVASVSLPALSTNIQKQQTGPALAKAINTLETANSLLLQQTDARYINSECAKKYISCLIDKNIITATSLPATPKYYTFKLEDSDAVAKAKAYRTKDGIVYYDLETLTANDKAPQRYGGSYYSVYVDVNGSSKRPNSLGRDLLRLYVDNKGAVIPYGGELYKNYTAGSAVSWHSSCNKKTEQKDITGDVCTGSIVDNGYQVIYKY